MGACVSQCPALSAPVNNVCTLTPAEVARQTKLATDVAAATAAALADRLARDTVVHRIFVARTLAYQAIQAATAPVRFSSLFSQYSVTNHRLT